ncbi:MAG: PorP/SprF family type IX secretion system membrane protein [Bacteroidota bacterium]|jgi:type IX secretion system PorP/SprF family membrane protein
MIRFILLSVSMFFAGVISAQDINFSQFYELPLLRNPALAGIYRGDVRFTSAFRNQWQSVPVRYQTTAAGFEMKFTPTKQTNDYISLGIQLTNDVAGDGRLGKTQVLPVLAYHKLISNSRNMYLTAGFIGGGVSQRVDPTKLRFDDQFVNGVYSSTNPTGQAFSNTNITYWDASVGLALSSDFGNNNKFFVGAAYFHFNEPKVAFSALNDIRLNKKYVLNGGLSVSTSDYNSMIFYGDLFSQGGSTQLQGGMMYKHKLVEDEEDMAITFYAGGFYRWADAFVPVVKFEYFRWSMGLSYDINVSKLTRASQARGGVELTLSYRSFLNIRNSTLEKFRCPIPF